MYSVENVSELAKSINVLEAVSFPLILQQVSFPTVKSWHEQIDEDTFIYIDNAVQVEDQEMDISIPNENTEETDSMW